VRRKELPAPITESRVPRCSGASRVSSRGSAAAPPLTRPALRGARALGRWARDASGGGSGLRMSPFEGFLRFDQQGPDAMGEECLRRGLRSQDEDSTGACPPPAPAPARGSGRMHLGLGTREPRWAQQRKSCRFSGMGAEDWFPRQEKRWEPRVRRPGCLASWGLSATRSSGDDAKGSRRNRRACSWRSRGAVHAGHSDALGDRRAVGARGRTDANPS
jgi:hypothetical protein